jgi:N6-L-threonylcarbamoyladenine synthase
VASSVDLQAKYGGIIPEQAAREQLKSIIPVIKETLRQAQCKSDDLDAIAVTYGPGLIGSLLVGVETAKVLAILWQKPIVPTNHLLAHFYANWINKSFLPSFPCLGLLVSGGHTDLVLFKDHGKYQYLGGTRDDAAGECFDKCARLLGLPYPGGPALAKLAKKGNPKAFDLPRPMINSDDFDFSFSGLKTAVVNLVNSKSLNDIPDLAASIQEAIVDVLVKKTIAAAQKYKIDQIVVAGGVAANQRVAEKTVAAVQTVFGSRAKIFLPPSLYCTDNAACVAAAAFYNFHPLDPLSLQANPNLGLTK